MGVMKILGPQGHQEVALEAKETKETFAKALLDGAVAGNMPLPDIMLT